MSNLQPSEPLKPRFQKFAVAAVILVFAFIIPLGRLAVYAAGDDLYSYILLIPVLCVYLAWLRKKDLPVISPPQITGATVFLIAGVLVLAAHFFLTIGPEAVDKLVLPAFAFVLFIVSAGFLFLGGAVMNCLTFPFALLIFMVPLASGLRNGLESWLQQGSAFCAGWLFTLSGLTVFQDDLIFHLPTITLRIAPECSGIHSSMVLLIVSLVAGYFFLRRPWKRAVLCLAVIPLALLRNGFRVYVLGELCTHIGPQMIDSPIHHRGGPLFFALSLIPFSLLLYFLIKSERPEVSGRPMADK